MALPALLLTPAGRCRLSGWLRRRRRSVDGHRPLRVVAVVIEHSRPCSCRAIVALFVMIALSAAARAAVAAHLTPITVALLIVFLVLVLGLAFDNHGSVERSPRRILSSSSFCGVARRSSWSSPACSSFAELRVPQGHCSLQAHRPRSGNAHEETPELVAGLCDRRCRSVAADAAAVL